jgi:hypothetical protein
MSQLKDSFFIDVDKTANTFIAGDKISGSRWRAPGENRATFCSTTVKVPVKSQTKSCYAFATTNGQQKSSILVQFLAQPANGDRSP